MTEFTFAMIKPDAVAAKNSGKIIDMMEQHGFEIMRMHKVHLDEETAREFYDMHKDRPFFNELVEFICSGPVIIMALSKENAIKDWRALMGATDSKKAEKGTVRNLFGTDIGKNAVHGSDSQEAAERELGLFFIDSSDDESDYEDEDMEICTEDECFGDDECCQNDE